MTTCPYNPNPTSIGTRYTSVCTYSTPDLIKGNILQYKMNSGSITLKSRYAQIARGSWTTRTTTWASQTDQSTNPNTKNLKRANYSGTLPTNCPPLSNSIFPSLPPLNSKTNPKPPPIIPPPPPVPPGAAPVLPPGTPVVPVPEPVLPADGGNLICNTTVDPCTGQTIFISNSSNCFPTDCSDVPGPIIYICYNSGLPTYLPRVVRTYSNGV